MTVLYGAHLSRRTVDEGIKNTGAEVAQVFVGSPKTWAAPRIHEPEQLEWKSRKFPVYVHSSYLVNPASTNELIREKTAKSLSEQFEASSLIGARGLVVHAGHAGGEDLDAAIRNWRETMKTVDTHGVQLLVENTAGGKAAPGRSLEGLERLWEVLEDFSPKLCLDTCHAWAGNVLDPSLEPAEAFDKLLDDLKSLGIEIGLTHLNGSKDERNGGRDHHSNLSDSFFDLSVSRSVAERAGVDAILETPGPLFKLKSDLKALLSTRA